MQLITTELIQQTVQSVIMICHVGSSYMFRPLQGHHQGAIYKDIKVQQILLKMYMYRLTNMCTVTKNTVF
jgi:hypothetical protein